MLHCCSFKIAEITYIYIHSQTFFFFPIAESFLSTFFHCFRTAIMKPIMSKPFIRGSSTASFLTAAWVVPAALTAMRMVRTRSAAHPPTRMRRKGLNRSTVLGFGGLHDGYPESGADVTFKRIVLACSDGALDIGHAPHLTWDWVWSKEG